MFAVENKLQGIYNAVAPNPVTNSKLVKKISECLGRPLWLPNIPRFVMRVLFGEMSYILYSSQRVGSKKLEDEGFVFDFTNIFTAINQLYQKKDPKRSPEAQYGNGFV